ncbi:MAG: PD40 domain-containing protein [Candidatus Aminicenantes bacterium]|nr:MAG: PD40 domain-containing protein [Candidatus Aminicenantes bacterium]
MDGSILEKIKDSKHCQDSIEKLSELIKESPPFYKAHLTALNEKLLEVQKEYRRKGKLEDLHHKIKLALEKDDYDAVIPCIKEAEKYTKNPEELIFTGNQYREAVELQDKITNSEKDRKYKETLVLLNQLHALNPYSKNVKKQCAHYENYFLFAEAISTAKDSDEIPVKIKQNINILEELPSDLRSDLNKKLEGVINNVRKKALTEAKKKQFYPVLVRLNNAYRIEFDSSRKNLVRTEIDSVLFQRKKYKFAKALIFTASAAVVAAVIYLATAMVPDYSNNLSAIPIIRKDFITNQDTGKYTLWASTRDISWARMFGGPDMDYVHDAQQTLDGGYILTGESWSLGGDKPDMFLIKTDTQGKKQWLRTFGGSDWEYSNSVRQTSDGGFILAGGIISNNKRGTCLIKTDTKGIMQWERTFGGPIAGGANAVYQTSDGGYIMAGINYKSYGNYVWLTKTNNQGIRLWDYNYGKIYSSCRSQSVQQTLDGGYILAVSPEINRGTNSDMILIKRDRDGKKQWERTFGGPSWDDAKFVRQTRDGGYILGGSTYSYGAGQYDAYLIKADSNGNKQWDVTFGGANDDHAFCAQQTSDGGFILAGWTQSLGAGEEDMWLIKTDNKGKKEWENTFGESRSDIAVYAQQTSDGGYILVGYSESYMNDNNDLLLIKIKSKEHIGKRNIQFSDDFSSNIGWLNETSGDFTIRDGRLNWNAKRSRVQKMYIPIEAYSGNFQMNFDFQLTYKQNNVWLEVGLAESLINAQNDPTNDPIGTFIKFGWIGGGTPYSVYYIIPLARYSNKGAYEGDFNFRNPSTYISYREDHWYNAMLEVNGNHWRLTVKNSKGQPVGQKKGSFPSGIGVYKYIYIGNPDNEDWPEGNGYLDNLNITTDKVSWEKGDLKNLLPRPSPPNPPSNLKGAAISGYKVKLEWDAPTSTNITKYNIYYDNGTGRLNYSKPIEVKHPGKTWISQALSKGITYKFGVRAENKSGEEEKNTNVVVSVKVIPLKQLTSQSGRDVEPCWSPDGLKIFYSSNYNIWEMNGVDGTGKKQLTQNGGVDPDCSPKNSKIVFMSDRNGQRNVWIMNIDGSAQQILTTESANYSPSWSPDGHTIAFASRRWRNGKIWKMDIDGGDQKYITTGWSDDWGPDYSPDGSKIAFASIRTGKIHVWMMNANGSEQKQLTLDPEDRTLATHGWSGPVWSPDGRFIAFSYGLDTNNDNTINWRDNDNICTIDMNGSKTRPITFSYSYDDENPAWSPGGTKIAFSSNRTGNWDIWITDYLFDSSAFPEANIISPIMNQMIEGEVPIIGTVRNNTGVDGNAELSLLSSWKLEYGKGVNPAKLIPIRISSEQIVNNTLATWNTAGLIGTYTIRLTATDGEDVNIQEVVVNIQIKTSSINSTK